jgi:hypothetical protein
LDFAPYQENSISFDPRMAILYLDDGHAIQPYAYQLWHHYSTPEAFASIEDLNAKIVLRTTNTQIGLRYQKSNDKAEMSKLVIGGLQSGSELLDIPPIIFEPRKRHLRYIYPGRTRDNLPIPSTIVGKCK